MVTLVYHLDGTVLRQSSLGVNFRDVGQVAGIESMVINLSAWFKGYKDMDPKLIPQSKEGEREANAR